MKTQAFSVAASNIVAFVIGLVAGTALGVMLMGEMHGWLRRRW